MSIKKLVWWNYLPSDERERGIYAQAYQRSFAVLTFCIGVFAEFLLIQNWKTDILYVPWVRFLFYPKMQGIVLFVTILLAYTIGSYKLWGEDLELKKPRQSGVSSIIIMLAVVLILSLVFSIFGPQHSYWLGESPF